MHDKDLASWLRRESEIEGKAETYEWLEEIGAGGMGRVFHARIKETGEDVAVKVLAPILDMEAKPKQRFRRELQALLRLDHPNIVGLRDGGWLETSPFLVMDWVDGDTLAEAVTERLRGAGKPDFEAGRRSLASIASALQLCHSVGLVHRDIKPSNIMIRGRDRVPVLIDFGLVRPTDRPPQSDRLTQTGEIVGTPAYASPEQIGAIGGVGPPADIWGFGATLYFCLTGREPFLGNSHFEIFSQIVTAEPTPPRELFPEVPPELESLAQACLRKKPEQRPSWDEILAVLRGKKDRAPKPTRAGPLTIVAGAVVLCLTMAVVMLQRGGALGPAFLEVEPSGSAIVTADRSLELRGRLGVEVRSLRAGARSIPIGSDRRFKTSVFLGSDGVVSIELLAFSGAGKELGRRRIRVRVDRNAPALRVEGDPGNGLVQARDSWRLSGNVTDLGATRLRLTRDPDGLELAQIELANSGPFQFEIPPSERPQILRLSASDQAGNVSSRRLIFCGPEVSRYVDECLDPGIYRGLKGALRKLDIWLQASAEERRQLADSIWLRRLESLDFLGFEAYGDREIPIAVYRHRISGARLHLIPGAQIYQVRFATARMILSMLENLPLDELNEVIDFTVKGGHVTPHMLQILGGAVRGRPFDSGEELRAYLRESPEGRESMRRFVRTFGELYDETPDGVRPRIPGFLQPEPGAARLPKKSLVDVQPFLLAQTEMTRGEWRRLVEGATEKGAISEPLFPASDIDLRDLSEVLVRTGDLRLPTRDEWRNAATAGADYRRIWGAEAKRRRAHQNQACWHRGNARDRTREAKDHSGQENPFGMIDIYGNLAELCEEITLRDRIGTEERYMPVMGGSIKTPAALLHPDLYRRNRLIDTRSPYIGFRLAVDLPED